MSLTSSAVPRRHRLLSVCLSALIAGGAMAGSVVPALAQQAVGSVQANLLVDQQNRIAELERLVQDLTGRVEETQFQNRQLTKKLDQLVGDVDFRFKQLEQGKSGAADGGASAPAAAPAQQGQAQQAGGNPPAGVLGYMGKDGATGAPANAAGKNDGGLPAGSVTDQYNYAFSLLRKNDYPGAETALKAFISQHPDHELAGNAQYWLGETFYVRKDYKQAAVAFLDGYKKYPSSAKAADNLLKLGMTAGELGQTKQACAAFSKLASEYPQASDVLKRRAQSEKERLRCS